MKSKCTRVVLVLGLGLGAVAISTPPSFAVSTCLGQAATWVGTGGDDTVSGTSGNDVFVGLGGNDTVDGLGGDDLFCLGDGNDVATGGDGTNHFVDGAGTDTYWGNPTDQGDVIDFSESAARNVHLLTGQADDDTLHDIHSVIGSPYDDSLIGDGQNNVILGGAGNDILEGGPGNDQIFGGAGRDLIIGHLGDDLYVAGSTLSEPSTGDHLIFEYATGPVVVSLDAGTAIGQGSDTISDFAKVTGSPYDDILTGDDLPNVLEGRAGDDVLDGAGGDDQLLGEAGDNTASFASSPNGVTANFEQATGDGTDSLYLFTNLVGSPFDDTLSQVMGSISGGAGNDTIIGPPFDNHLYGGTGDDIIRPGEGNQYLMSDNQICTGPGNDTVTYEQFGSGVDVDLAAGHATAMNTTTTFLDTPEVLTGSPFDDLLTGSANADTINGLGGADTVLPGEGDDQIATGAGSDAVSYADAAHGVQVDLTTGQAVGAGTDTFLDLPETLVGSPYDDLLTGSPNSDSIDGLAGADTLRGLAGDDHYAGGAGIDTVDFSTASGAITANLVTGQASGQGLDTLSGVEAITGSSYGDTLIGNGLANLLRGAGNDRMAGLGGADQYLGGAGMDSIDFGSAKHPVSADLTQGTAAGEGRDTLAGIETLIGSRFSDTFIGNALANLLRGGAGADLLDGRGGQDSLFGNSGPDLLVGGPGIDSCSGGPGTDGASSCEAKVSIP